MNAEHSNDNRAVDVEQVVFTSIRSPMGEGYRIIAAGSSLRPDEKAEITRRSPSHGSLCAGANPSGAVLSYPLASGRFCVGFCCSGGREHTARGGDRVYTHYAVLDRDGFARFGFDPFRVASALRAAVGDALILKQLPTLPKLSLNAGDAACDAKTGETPAAAALGALATVAWSGQPVVASEPSTGDSVAARLVAILPASIRKTLSLSVGLKYAMSRQIRASFVECDSGETERALRGQSIRWFDFKKGGFEANGSDANLSEWIEFVLSRMKAGRAGEISALTAEMVEVNATDLLSRVARLSRDIDAVVSADSAALEKMAVKWKGVGVGVETRLLEKFRAACAVRSAELKAAAEREAELAACK